MRKPAAPRETCANCRFALPSDDIQGICRKRLHFMPPNSSTFAPVKLDWWCGDYEKPTVKR